MKMSQALFSELKNDITIVAARLNAPMITNSDMWNLFHKVQFDRCNDDSHPAFQRGRARILSFWSKHGESQAMQGNDNWLNRFYNDENLDDSHILTALRKIRGPRA